MGPAHASANAKPASMKVAIAVLLVILGVCLILGAYILVR
jgi:hypothetical protein